MITKTKEVLNSIVLPGLVTSSNVTMYSNLNRFSASAGPLVATLPDCMSHQGEIYYVQKIDATANTVTIVPTGADTIDGAGFLTLSNLNQMATLFATKTIAGVAIWTVVTAVASAVSVVTGTPQLLTIAGGIITPTAPTGAEYEAVVQLMGEGGAGIADQLDKVVCNAAAWAGKKLMLLIQPTAGTITVATGANIKAAVNRTLDSALDNIEYRITSTNDVIAELSFANNG